jgi:hypothetical protein
MFEDLWQEHIFPSGYTPLPQPTTTTLSAVKPSNSYKRSNDPHADRCTVMDDRYHDRKRRMVVSGLFRYQWQYLEFYCSGSEFVDNGGQMDHLNVHPIRGDGGLVTPKNDDDTEVAKIVQTRNDSYHGSFIT